MADLTLFVDGSCLRDQYRALKAAYAACSISEFLEASYLPNVTSAQASQIDQTFHYSYYPQSSGVGERMNGPLKNKLTKVCYFTGLKWPCALFLALMSIRCTPDKKFDLLP